MRSISLRVAIALLTFVLGIGAWFVLGGFGSKAKKPTCSNVYHQSGCVHRLDVPPPPPPPVAPYSGCKFRN